MQPRINNRVSLLTERQIAEALGVSVATIRRWRLRSRGPRFIRAGAAIRYPEQDFLRWIASRPGGGERIPEPAND